MTLAAGGGLRAAEALGAPPRPFAGWGDEDFTDLVRRSVARLEARVQHHAPGRPVADPVEKLARAWAKQLPGRLQVEQLRSQVAWLEVLLFRTSELATVLLKQQRGGGAVELSPAVNMTRIGALERLLDAVETTAAKTFADAATDCATARADAATQTAQTEQPAGRGSEDRVPPPVPKSL